MTKTLQFKLRLLLSLISDATSAKMELSSGGEVNQQGIAYAQNMKNRYVEITKTTDILHEEDNDNDNDNTATTNEDSSDMEEGEEGGEGNEK